MSVFNFELMVLFHVDKFFQLLFNIFNKPHAESTETIYRALQAKITTTVYNFTCFAKDYILRVCYSSPHHHLLLPVPNHPTHFAAVFHLYHWSRIQPAKDDMDRFRHSMLTDSTRYFVEKIENEKLGRSLCNIAQTTGARLKWENCWEPCCLFFSVVALTCWTSFERHWPFLGTNNRMIWKTSFSLCSWAGWDALFQFWREWYWFQGSFAMKTFILHNHNCFLDFTTYVTV